MKKYYGWNTEEGRVMFATVTGQMDDGVLVYTEIEQNEDGSIKTKNGEPVLILNNQFTRKLKNGWQEFIRL
jgi:hypothetical protein